VNAQNQIRNKTRKKRDDAKPDVEQAPARRHEPGEKHSRAEERPSREDLSSASSLSSSYPVLPPIGKASNFSDDEGTHLNLEKDEQLSAFLRDRLDKVTERTLSVMLMEMRRLDRDRDRVLAPVTINSLVDKYRLPIGPCLPYLHKRFRDLKFVGSTNYEHVMKFLEDRRLEKQGISERQGSQEQEENADVVYHTVQPTRKTSRPPERKRSVGRSRNWTERDDARLMADLSRSVGNQIIDMDRLAMVMREKDHYGNEQVSSQQAWASLSTCLIVLEKPVFNRWLQSADMAGRGIYSIPVLLDALETAISTAPPLPIHKSKVPIAIHSGRKRSTHMHDIRNSPPVSAASFARFSSNSTSPTRGGSKTEGERSKDKYFTKLQHAMVQSYNNHNGYLPVREVESLTSAYSTVYHLGLDRGEINSAINYTRTTDIRHGLINIERYLQYLRGQI